MIATLYNVEVSTINEHIAKIYSDSELEQGATIRNFRIVQTVGTRQGAREVKHYSLQTADREALRMLGKSRHPSQKPMQKASWTTPQNWIFASIKPSLKLGIR